MTSQTDQSAASGRPPARPRFRWRLVVTVGVVSAVVLVYVRTRVIDAVVVEGRSMYPTFRNGTRLLAWHGCYRPGDLKRGSIVLLYDPIDGGIDVKRVIALGGDRLTFVGQRVYRNGRLLNEPYTRGGVPSPPIAGRLTIPQGSVFVMGDNRGNSTDSRTYGAVPLHRIRGRAFLAIWPPSEWGRGQRGMG